MNWGAIDESAHAGTAGDSASLRLLVEFLVLLAISTCLVAPVGARAADASRSSPPQASPTEANIVTIGLVDTFSPEFYVESYSPTLEHLKNALPDRRFRYVEIDRRRVEEDVARLAPDFVLSAASVYAGLAHTSGAQQIAAREPSSSHNVAQTVASTFIVANNSPYRDLKDLKGKRVAVSSLTSFDGWLIAQGELARHGLDPEDHFGEHIETDYGVPDAASLVRLGIADAGILSTCEYERLLNAGLITAADFRILAAREADGGCVRSTDRYPDVIFASLPHADTETVRSVTVALLSMPVWSASDGSQFRWTVCNDFVPTNSLLETLRLGPYAYLRDLSPEALWARFKTEIILGLLFGAAVLFHIITVNLLVRRRTAELAEAVEEVKRFYQDAHEARRRVEALERTGVVAQLSTLFAHEIKQPLMNITLYAGAMRLFLSKKGELGPEMKGLLEDLSSEVNRASDIVEHVRGYAKKRIRTPVACDLVDIVRTVLAMFPSAGPNGSSEGVVHTELPEPGRAIVKADPFELQFVCANFLKNALAAVKTVEAPAVTVSAACDGDVCRLVVADNGPALSDEAFAALGGVQESGKAEGLGFGLAIASAIAETNGGHLVFERRTPQGLSASIVLPAASSTPAPNTSSSPNSTADTESRP